MKEFKKIQNVDGDYSIFNNGSILNNETNKEIGFIGYDGYKHVIMKVDGKVKNIRVHQLVWDAFGRGKRSRNLIVDHKDRNRANNKIENLQLITVRKNLHKDMDIPISGEIGVHWNTEKQRWCAEINFGKERFKLGYRKTIIEAKELYDKALSDWESSGLLPSDLKERLPENKKRCTGCKKILFLNQFDFYKTCRGNISKRAKCKECHKEYRKMNDVKYRDNTGLKHMDIKTANLMSYILFMPKKFKDVLIFTPTETDWPYSIEDFDIGFKSFYLKVDVNYKLPSIYEAEESFKKGLSFVESTVEVSINPLEPSDGFLFAKIDKLMIAKPKDLNGNIVEDLCYRKKILNGLYLELRGCNLDNDPPIQEQWKRVERNINNRNFNNRKT